MKIRGRILLYCALTIATGLASFQFVNASDHDDGISSSKTRNVNLTDLFVFREDNQTDNAANADNLILIMDSNPHTPAGQQDFFSTNAQYDFKISRVTAANKNATASGTENITLRFEFGEPNADQRQLITMTVIRDGALVPATAVSGTAEVLTTSLMDGKARNLRLNQLQVASSTITVFAGMREDPFFFDFEQFVKVRAGAAGTGPKIGFRPSNEAVDYFRKENINSIAVRVPIEFLQTSANEPIFDVWETISIK